MTTQWIESPGRQRSMSRTSPSRMAGVGSCRDHACASAAGLGTRQGRTAELRWRASSTYSGFRSIPIDLLPKPTGRCQDRSDCQRTDRGRGTGQSGRSGRAAALTETEVELLAVAPVTGDPERIESPAPDRVRATCTGYRSWPIDSAFQFAPPRAHGSSARARRRHARRFPARMQRSGRASGNVAKWAPEISHGSRSTRPDRRFPSRARAGGPDLGAHRPLRHEGSESDRIARLRSRFSFRAGFDLPWDASPRRSIGLTDGLAVVEVPLRFREKEDVLVGAGRSVHGPIPGIGLRFAQTQSERSHHPAAGARTRPAKGFPRGPWA